MKAGVGIFVGLFFLVASLTRLALAQDAYYFGTRPLAMGGSGAALADDNNAIQLNPAGIAFQNNYTIDLNYQRTERLRKYAWWKQKQWEEEEVDGNEPKLNEPERVERFDIWHLSVVDAFTSPYLKAGISFTADGFPGATFEDNRDYRFGLALAWTVAKLVGMGFGGTYIKFETSDLMTATAGLMVRPWDFISIGVAVRDFVRTDTKYHDWVTSSVAGGVALTFLRRRLSIAGDVDYDYERKFELKEQNERRDSYHAGIEGFVITNLGLRGGYRYEAVSNRHFYSAGIGYVTETGALGYTFEGDVNEPKNVQHSIQVAIKF